MTNLPSEEPTAVLEQPLPVGADDPTELKAEPTALGAEDTWPPTPSPFAPAPAAPARPSRLNAWLNSAPVAWTAGVLAAGVAAFHYLRTLHPGVGPTAEAIGYQTAAFTLGVSHAPGNPLYTLLGRLVIALPWGSWLAPLAPWGIGRWGDNLAWRLNIFSALVAAVAVLLTVRLTHRLTRSVGAALLGGLALAAARGFWQQALVSDPAALYALLLIALWLAGTAWAQTRRRGYYFAGVVLFALAVGVQPTALFLLPALLWGALSIDFNLLLRPRYFSATLLALIGGSLLFLYVPLRALVWGPPPFCDGCPESLRGLPAFLATLRRPGSGVVWGLDAQAWLPRSAEFGARLMENFWPWGVLLGGIGLAVLLRRDWRLGGAWALGLLGGAAHVITLRAADWAWELTAVSALFAPLIGVGAAAGWRWLRAQSAVWPSHPRLHMPMLLLLGATAVLLMAAPFPEPLRPWLPARLPVPGRLLWVAAVLVVGLITAAVSAQRRDVPQRAARALLSLALLAATAVLVAAPFTHNAAVVDQSGQIAWQRWARELLRALEPNARVLAPPQATEGYAQAAALRFVAWAEGPAADLQLVEPPGQTQRTGPEPGYIAWEAAQVDLAARPVYAIEINDERLRDYALLPLRRADGRVIGYRLVGARTADGVTPWLDDATWQAVSAELVYP